MKQKNSEVFKITKYEDLELIYTVNIYYNIKINIYRLNLIFI